MGKPLEYEIIKQLGVLSEKNSGWTKELNLISWGGGAPKFDVRKWSPDHEKMGKGVTLDVEEAAILCDLLRPELNAASK